MVKSVSILMLVGALLVTPSALASDRGRPLEPLETFDLEKLRYVAREITREEVVAIVVDPTGRRHRVKVGNYLGKQDGRVSVIKAAEVILVELRPDGSGGWIEHIAALPHDPER